MGHLRPFTKAQRIFLSRLYFLSLLDLRKKNKENSALKQYTSKAETIPRNRSTPAAGDRCFGIKKRGQDVCIPSHPPCLRSCSLHKQRLSRTMQMIQQFPYFVNICFYFLPSPVRLHDLLQKYRLRQHTAAWFLRSALIHGQKMNALLIFPLYKPAVLLQPDIPFLPFNPT